jgi:hypothetical protein
MKRTAIKSLIDKVIGGVAWSKDNPGFYEITDKSGEVLMIADATKVFDKHENHFDDSRMEREENSIEILQALLTLMRSAKVVMHDDTRHTALLNAYRIAEKAIKNYE